MSQYAVETFYALLGISRTASEQEIKVAYRRAARVSHPDNGATEAMFRTVNNAYETLKDPSRRAAYDRSLDGTEQSPTSDDSQSWKDNGARQPDPQATEPEPEPGPQREPEAPRYHQPTSPAVEWSNWNWYRGAIAASIALAWLAVRQIGVHEWLWENFGQREAPGISVFIADRGMALTVFVVVAVLLVVARPRVIGKPTFIGRFPARFQANARIVAVGLLMSFEPLHLGGQVPMLYFCIGAGAAYVAHRKFAKS